MSSYILSTWLYCLLTSHKNCPSPTMLTSLCDTAETTIFLSQVNKEALGSVSLYCQPAAQLAALHKHQTWDPKCKWPCQTLSQ